MTSSTEEVTIKNLLSQILGIRIEEIGFREMLILKSLTPLSSSLFPEATASLISVYI